MGEDRTWVFEAMSQFLKGPQWALPVWDFIDENCVVFDSLEENQHAHFEVHNAFKDTVESLLEMMLEELSVTPEEFFQLMQSYGTSDVGKEVFEQILAVDDFVSFKQMMVKRNMELELDSMNALQNLAQQVDAGEVAEPAPPTEEDDEEAQLQKALELSLLEHTRNGERVMDPDPEDFDRKQAALEDADLKQAIALSLQLEEDRLEEERQRQAFAEQAFAERAMAEAEPPTEPPAEPPREHRPAPAPRATLAPISMQSRGASWKPPEKVTAAAARAAEVRERVEAEKEPERHREAPSSSAPSKVSQHEMAARAEHLKKQRDLILQREKKKRQDQFGAAPAPPAAPADPAADPGAALGAHRAAGYSSAEAAPVSPSRAQLSRSLGLSLKAGLAGSDLNSDLEARIESHARRADLEMTKAQLRAEYEDSKR